MLQSTRRSPAHVATHPSAEAAAHTAPSAAPETATGAAATHRPAPIALVSPSIPKMLRYVEWIFLVMLGFRVGSLMLNKPLAFEMDAGDYTMFGVAAMLGLLSLSFPIHRPIWQRRIYIVAEVLCLLISRAFTPWGLNLFLYLVLVKSSFLLRRRDVIATTVVAGIAWHASLAWQLSQEMSVPIAQLRQEFEASLAHPKHVLILDAVVNSTIVYCAASLLVILLCLTVLAERNSRQQAAQLSEEVEALAADLERNRIAREIHDSLGHTLTTLNVQLEVAQALHTQNPEHSLQALNQAKVLSTQSLQDVRRAVSTLRSGNFNLSEALVDLVSQIQQTAHQSDRELTIETDIDLPHLPLQMSRQLFLIAKEGLTNIQKHSEASVVTLWAENRPEGITLGLADNGIGFSMQASARGFGLRGMRERVQLLNGQIKIHSAAGEGTFIQVTVPQLPSRQLPNRQLPNRQLPNRQLPSR